MSQEDEDIRMAMSMLENIEKRCNVSEIQTQYIWKILVRYKNLLRIIDDVRRL